MKRRKKGIRKRRVFVNNYLKITLINAFFAMGLWIASSVNYTTMLQISSDIKIQKENIKELEAERNTMQAILEPFIDKHRIERIAKTRLDLKYPTSEDMVALRTTTNERIITLESFE